MPELSIAFEGAARTVTGSRHRIAWGERQWLFDCGLYQGHREEADRINRTFRFDPGELDFMVLSHAHLDHSGNLPTLIHQGYPGVIHATPATADLCRVMLADSAFLMERDIEHLRKRGRERRGSGEVRTRELLYTQADVEATLSRFVTHKYHAPWELMPGVTVEYFDAGHILGSALTTFEFRDGARTFRLGMSGDVGRAGRLILRDPETHPGVDALVIESTYGNRLHPSEADSERLLAEAVIRTVQRGGRIIVPAFAVGRAQELVVLLNGMMKSKAIPELPIYVDSPMASDATQVFRHHVELFDDETRQSFREQGGAPFGFERLRFTRSPAESRALNDIEHPIIVLSASGMCEGGRVLHHLQHGLSDPRNLVMFVGFQAEGTLGRRIVDGAEVVSIYGEPVRRRAEIVKLDGFSAHADQAEMLEWVGRLNPLPKHVYLVHGEFEAAAVLAEKLTERFGIDAHVPVLGEKVSLWM